MRLFLFLIIIIYSHERLAGFTDTKSSIEETVLLLG